MPRRCDPGGGEAQRNIVGGRRCATRCHGQDYTGLPEGFDVENGTIHSCPRCGRNGVVRHEPEVALVVTSERSSSWATVLGEPRLLRARGSRRGDPATLSTIHEFTRRVIRGAPIAPAGFRRRDRYSFGNRFQRRTRTRNTTARIPTRRGRRGGYLLGVAPSPVAARLRRSHRAAPGGPTGGTAGRSSRGAAAAGMMVGGRA